MDAKLIYRKTRQGEEALKARTQLKSGRLRAALIMVDGLASVGELSLRLGRKNRPDDRLAQLERLGLIEPIPTPAGQGRRSKTARRKETLPPVAPPATDPTADLGPAAVNEAAAAGHPQPPTPEGEPDAAPIPEAEAIPLAMADSEVASAAAAPAIVPATAQTNSQLDETLQPEGPPAVAEAPSGEPNGIAPEGDTTPAPPPEPEPERNAADAPRDPEAKDDQQPQSTIPADDADILAGTAMADEAASSSRNDDEQSGDRPQLEAKASKEGRRSELPRWVAAAVARLRAARAPLRRSPRQKASRAPRRGAVLLLAVAVVVVPLVAAVMLLPQEGLRSALEQRASARFGRPVHIEGMGIAWQPQLGLRLDGVRVAQGHPARAARVVISPSIHGLSDVLRPRFDLDVSELVLEGEVIAGLCGLAGIDAATAQASQIDTITIAGLSLKLPRAAVEGLNADINLDPARGAPAVVVRDPDDRLQVELLPADQACGFSASGSGWHPPFAPALVLDGLRAKGKIDAKGLRLESFDARTNDGLIAGSGSLAWEPRAALDLRFELQHLDLARLLAALGMAAAAQGELDARLHFTASAPDLARLPAALGGGGPVSVSRGAIERFDLVEAARNPGTERIHGGALRFEQLNAHLRLDRGSATLHNLRLNAGALSADGALSVKRDATLDGGLNVHLQGAGGEISVPLRVDGSVAAPELGAGRERTTASAPPVQEQ